MWFTIHFHCVCEGFYPFLVVFAGDLKSENKVLKKKTVIEGVRDGSHEI